jgi:TolB protein
MILYATEHQRRGVLAAVSIDGQAHHRLLLQDGDVREPAWAPFSSK